MKAFILSLAALVCACATAPSPLASDAEIRWMRTYASEHDDWINDIVPLRGGGVLAVGFLNRNQMQSDWRALVVALDIGGRERWRAEYGEGGGADAFWNGAETTDGALALVGFTTRIGAGGIDAWFARTDTQGRLLGESSFGDSEYDRVTDLAPTADGGWILVGHSVSPETSHRRVLLLKVDGAGREQWRRIVTERESSGALYVEPSGDGAFIVSGGASQGDDSDVLLLKVDSDGREIWRRLIGAENSADVNHALVVRPDGRIVALGYTRSWGAIDYDLFAVTLNGAGETLTRSVFGGAGDDRPIGARLDPEGRIWTIGYTRSAGAGDWDVLLASVDPQGRFDPGATIFAGPADDNGTAVHPLANGDILIAGYSSSLPGGAQDAFLARIRRPDPARADPRFSVRP